MKQFANIRQAKILVFVILMLDKELSDLLGGGGGRGLKEIKDLILSVNNTYKKR